MNGLGTADGLLLDMFLIIVTMSVLDWRESRWSRRTDARQRDRTPNRQPAEGLSGGMP